MSQPESFPRQHARTRRFSLGVPRNATVTRDGRVVFLRTRSGDDPETCLWVHDAGGTHQAADPRRLGEALDDLPPAERARRERAREAAGGIVAYSLDADGRIAAFALGGRLFVVDLLDGSHRELPVAGPVFDPRLDPSGRRVAYVSGRALRMVELDGDDRELAGEADPDVSWGAAEFVAAEEMGRSRGFWWAPDGRSLLATRVDVGPVATWWIGDPARPERPPSPIRYPAAGTANARVQLVHIGLDTSQRAVPWDADGRYEYLADVVWQSDQPPLIVRQTRDQRRLSVAALDEGGDLRDLRIVEDDHWVELVAGAPTWAGERLVTVEDRGDTRRLCLDGEPLGPDGLQVRAVVHADRDAVLVTATADPTELHVHRFGLDGSHEQLTDEPGVHAAVAGGPGVVWVASATLDRPGVRVTVRRADGQVEEIDSVAEAPVLRTRPQLRRSRNRQLASVLVLPTDHDGETPLPVLCDPYGGPHALRVVRSHNAHLTSQWFADAGFAVLVTDGRGTPGRGPAWERAVHGDLAGPVLEDQLEALDDAAGDHHFLDLGRVAIRGWSFGGYLAALAVLRRPDRFHAAVAGAPVTSWRLYDTHYTERYLGNPALDPEPYDRTDLLLEARRLERPLLLVHGLADDNVVAAHTLQLSSALLAAGRPHQVLPLSGVTHMTPQEVVAENLLRLELGFLRRALGLTPPTDDPAAQG
jgi:dipeptidyl-peptidase 4